MAIPRKSKSYAPDKDSLLAQLNKDKGPLRPLAPLVEWWTDHYGFADPSADFSQVRPWKETMEKHLANVSYQESYFGTMFLCHSQKT